MLTPGTAEYSPAHAATASDLRAADIFAAETRDAGFAVRRERFLRGHFAAVFARHAPDIELVELECRTGSCRAVFDAPDDEWSSTLIQATAWGKRMATTEIGRAEERIWYEVISLMDRELLDHATYERYLTDWLRKIDRDLVWLREQRTGKEPE